MQHDTGRQTQLELVSSNTDSHTGLCVQLPLVLRDTKIRYFVPELHCVMLHNTLIKHAMENGEIACRKSK